MPKIQSPIYQIDSPSQNFKIVSWNTLANQYTHYQESARPGVNRKVFNQYHRHELLGETFQRFVDTNVDFICLQEVDFKIAREILVLKNSYTRILTPTGHGRGDTRVDACCIFYKTENWEIVGNEKIVNLDDLAERKYGSSKLRKTFRRGNFGIIARFRKKSHPDRMVMICNTHLYWNPEFEYVKLRQAHYLCKKAKSFAKHLQSQEQDEIHLIFCGDLNSLPGGLVHSYLSMGEANTENLPSFAKECLECPFDLKSIHAKCDKNGSLVAGKESIDYTNSTADFRGVIDYIFHEPSLSMTNQMCFPAFEKSVILPTVTWPSDHLAIGAEFSFP